MYYTHTGYTTSEELLLRNGVEIHSIKRTSDSEVFTIGDKTTSGRIFRIVVDGFSNVYFYHGVNSGPNLDLKEIKKSLFTTEDGTHIFKEDIYWYVTSTYGLYKHEALELPEDGVKTFASEEEAENYIVLHKPCISLEDLCTFFTIGIEEILLIKEFVKNK